MRKSLKLARAGFAPQGALFKEALAESNVRNFPHGERLAPVPVRAESNLYLRTVWLRADQLAGKRTTRR
jgi:hypothetical protein